jgi:hypothetical protein
MDLGPGYKGINMSGSPFIIRICGLLLLSLGGRGYLDESSSIRSGKVVAHPRAQTLKPSTVMSSGPLSGLSVLGRTCTCCIIRLDGGRAEEKKYSNQGTKRGSIVTTNHRSPYAVAVISERGRSRVTLIPGLSYSKLLPIDSNLGPDRLPSFTKRSVVAMVRADYTPLLL